VELSPEQGFVRSCDSCFQKQNKGPNHTASIMGFPTMPVAPRVPIPSSIFKLDDYDARIALSVDNRASETASCRLSPTLSCHCYGNIRARQAVQTAHFELQDERRLRLDLQLQSSGDVLLTARMQTKTSVLVGVGAARVQSVPGSGIRILDDFRVELGNVDTKQHEVLAGSIAWKLNNSLKCGPSDSCGSEDARLKLRSAVDAEITEMNHSLNEKQEEESARRQALNIRSQEVEAAKLRSNTDQQPTVNVQALRQRRSSQWEAVEDLMSQRNQIKVRVEHLRLLHECLVRVEGVAHEVANGTPFSCMCFRCLGTIVV